MAVCRSVSIGLAANLAAKGGSVSSDTWPSNWTYPVRSPVADKRWLRRGQLSWIRAEARPLASRRAGADAHPTTDRGSELALERARIYRAGRLRAPPLFAMESVPRSFCTAFRMGCHHRRCDATRHAFQTAAPSISTVGSASAILVISESISPTGVDRGRSQTSPRQTTTTMATTRTLAVIAFAPPLLRRTLKKTVVTMADPMAVASCCTALREPLALPASSWVTSPRATS